jgi:hypothetical protein
MDKINKKFTILIIGLILLTILLGFALIYAKYISSAYGNTKMAIARWDIKVNNLSIKDNTNISNTLKPIFPGNSNIAANIIAPTAEGYFDLNFDFTGADVSFKYEITPSVDSSSSVKDLVATGYSIADNGGEFGNRVNLENYNDKISDTVLLNSPVKKRTIRIYILWNDDETSQKMSDDEDTNSTKSEKDPLFHVNIIFTQVAS